MSKGKGRNGLKVLFGIAFVVYLAVVVYITILSRQPEERRFDVNPFRSYILLIKYENDFYFGQIFYNILMTVPFGIFVSYFFKKARKFKFIVIYGFMFSLAIETVQYITGRGLFEFDDLFNNTLGVVIGFIIYIIVHCVLVKMIDKT